MKAVFGINITEDKHNSHVDGEVFISKRISENQQQSLDEERENIEKLEKKSNLPIALNIVYYICLLVSLVGLVGVTKNLGKLSIAQMYSNAPLLFIAIGICAPVWLVLFIYKKTRLSSVSKSEDLQITLNHVESQVTAAFAALGIPSNAKEMDVLCYRYKLNGDQISVKNIGMTTHLNLELMVYVADDCLCLADTEMRYSIPLKSISKIKTVNKRISVPEWNKDTPCNKGEYKQYKITKNQYGFYFKPYYSIEIHYQNEEYELLIPPYELPGMEELIKLTPVE